MKIGICLQSLGVSARRGLRFAADLEVPGVQIDARGDLSPEKLTDTGRRELRTLLKGNNLEMTAVNCPLRRGLDEGADLDRRLEHVRRVMGMAAELGCGRVIVEPGDYESETLRHSLTDLTRHGDRTGVLLALESGLLNGGDTAAFVETFDTGSLGVNFDPANHLLNGHDPLAAVLPLKGHIAHMHAHDARKKRASRTSEETALGAGDVEWMGLLGALAALDYAGWVVVEQHAGDDRPADIRRGVEFLQRLMP